MLKLEGALASAGELTAKEKRFFSPPLSSFFTADIRRAVFAKTHFSLSESGAIFQIGVVTVAAANSGPVEAGSTGKISLVAGISLVS